jgi:hypothetical protein
LVAVTALPTNTGPWLSRKVVVAAIGLLAIAVAVALGVYSRVAVPGSDKAGSRLVHAAGLGIGQAINGVKTVASMIAGRSPGERAVGELASLKHKRVSILHERALPKIRRSPPESPLANIVAPPPGSPAIVPPVAAPLYNAVTTPPPGATTVGESPPTFFPAMAPPPGGGFVVPPIVTQVTPPLPPEVPPPAVPEPASWAMMLIGFGFVGWTIRRRGRAALLLS